MEKLQKETCCPYMTWKAILGKNTSKLNFTLSSCPSTTIVHSCYPELLLFCMGTAVCNVKLWLVVLYCVLEGGIWDGLSEGEFQPAMWNITVHMLTYAATCTCDFMHIQEWFPNCCFWMCLWHVSNRAGWYFHYWHFNALFIGPLSFLKTLSYYFCNPCLVSQNYDSFKSDV